jgi:tight adherence protein C
MDSVMQTVFSFSGYSPAFMLGVLVFLSVATLSFGVMGLVHVRGSLRRRVADVSGVGTIDHPVGESRALRHASVQLGRKLIDYTTRYYSAADDSNMRRLRRRLVQAGFLNPRAAGFFFIARLVLSICLFIAAYIAAPFSDSGSSTGMSWFVVGISGLVGYMAPSFYVNRRISKRREQHRAGFPDLMDLLVVCTDAGLSMEAALDRIGRELVDSYPSLSANLHMSILELRAGRSLSEVLEHLGDRLGIDEARAFATLLQQSNELGSSLTDALRVYSDDMRHKRLSRAEEKAYSLPAKLAIPLILCVFPALLIVIMLPAFIRVKLGGF